MPNMMGYTKETQVPMTTGSGTVMRPQYQPMDAWEAFLFDLLKNQGGLLDAYRRGSGPLVKPPSGSLLGKYSDYVDQPSRVNEINKRAM